MARNLQYPPSVKPGLPRLGDTPKGWSRVTFGDVLKVVEREAQLKDDDEYQLVVARRNRGGIAPRERLLGREILTKSQFRVHSGDFLISKRQIVHGACGIVPPDLHGSVVSNEYAVLHARNGLNLKYLEYYTHSLHFQQTCFHASVGVAVEKMIFRLDEWLRHEFDLPPKRVQDYVVDVLSTWDRGIEGVQKMIAAKRQVKLGLAQQLLTGRHRFPGFSGPDGGSRKNDLPSSWVMSLPDDWNWGYLNDVAQINPTTLPESTDPTYRFRYIDLSMVKDGAVTFPESTTEFRESPSRARRVVSKDDILMATVRPNLQGFAHWDKDVADVVCSTGFAVIRVSGVCPGFVYQWLFSRNVSQYCDRCIAGSNYPALNPTDVKKICIPLPSLGEQQQIAAVLGNVDREAVLLERKMILLVKQRNGLLQKLLDGRIQVTG